MKIRNGFVSNSSSSSFVVRRETSLGNKESVISDSKAKKLEKFGFRKTGAHSPEDVPGMWDKAAWEKTEKFLAKDEYKNWYNYGYEITCNQDDVIQFLIENSISFIASCHYGHESIIYNADTDKIYTAHNFGRCIETYTSSVDIDVESYNKTKPVDVMTGKQWLKKNKY